MVKEENIMANSRMTDVAKAAGVSLTTVGRVLNGGYVSEDKRKRVNDAIQKLGYVPNKMARSLKVSESKFIGILLRHNDNQLYAKIGAGIERAIEKAGYNALSMTHIDGKYEPQIDEFISRKVDAIIIPSNGELDIKLLEKLQNAGIPVVLVEREREALQHHDFVMINDIGGAKKAVNFLIEKGRKRIGFIGASSYGSVEKERYTGYCEALQDAGLQIDENIIYAHGRYNLDDGYIGMKKFIEEKADFDAVYCTSDILAAGAMQALYEYGIKVPDEVMLVGYDDTIARLLSPPITSVALDLEGLGEAAVNFALSRIKEPELDSRFIRIDTVLHER